MENMKKLTFNEFCVRCCDRLYDPHFSDETQCTGYRLLKQMRIEQITPFSLEEMDRWENNPTAKELLSTPDVRYLRFLHPVLRSFIVENWDLIKNLEV